jgi:hypothetical protein
VPLLHQTYRRRGEMHNRFTFLTFYFALYLSIYCFTHPIDFVGGFRRSSKWLHQQPLQQLWRRLDRRRSLVQLQRRLDWQWSLVLLSADICMCSLWTCMCIWTCDLFCGSYVVYACDKYCEVWINVLDWNVYMDVLYIICAMCRFYNFSCVGYSIFMQTIYSIG